MSNSINTNSGALIALQALNASSNNIQKTENEISTGLTVSSPTDNGATWAVAQNERSEVAGWQTVTDSLNRGQSIVDVAVSAAQSISDLLNQIKAKALAYSDPTNDVTSQAAYQNDIESLLSEVNNISTTSTFDGVNLLTANGSSSPVQFQQNLGPFWTANIGNVAGTISADVSDPNNSEFEADFDFLGSDNGNFFYTPPQPLDQTITFDRPASDGSEGIISVGPDAQIENATFTPDAQSSVSVLSDPSGGKFNLDEFNLTSSGLSLDQFDWSNPDSIISAVDAAISTVNSATAQLGTQSNMLASYLSFTSHTQDTLTTGVGNLVDADVAQDSAKLTAEQTKQQLAAQAVSIANNAPSVLLTLFNGRR